MNNFAIPFSSLAMGIALRVYLYLPFANIILKSIRRPSDISSILSQRLPAWAVIPTVIRFWNITGHTPEPQSPPPYCEGFKIFFRCLAYPTF